MANSTFDRTAGSHSLAAAVNVGVRQTRWSQIAKTGGVQTDEAC